MKQYNEASLKLTYKPDWKSEVIGTLSGSKKEKPDFPAKVSQTTTC